MDTNHSTRYNRWLEILRLGATLLEQPTVKAQIKLLTDNCQRILQCNVNYWLLDTAFPANLGNYLDIDLFGFDDLPPEVIRSIRKQENVTSSYQDSHIHISNKKQPIATTIMISRGEILGAIQFSREEKPFTQIELELIKGLSLQSSIVFDAARQKHLDHWQESLFTLVRQVSAQIASVLDLDELSCKVTQLILQTFNYYYVAIFTNVPGQETLRFQASAGPGVNGQIPCNLNQGNPDQDPSVGFSPIYSIKKGEGIIGTVAQSGLEILANDVTREPHYRSLDGLPETKSEVALPIKIGEKILGVLDVQSDQLNAFNDIDLLILHALADNIAIAMINARLYGDLIRRANQISLVSEISNAVASVLDLDILLNDIVTLIFKRFNYPSVSIYTLQPGQDKVIYRAGRGDRVYKSDQGESVIDLSDGKSYISAAIREGRTQFLKEDSVSDQYSSSISDPFGSTSALVVPLRFGGRILGALEIQGGQDHIISEEDIPIFESLADNIAVALRNANLYHSEQWRRQVAESMKEIIGLISAEVELGQVLERILIELDKSLPCNATAIWLLETAESDTQIGQFTSPLNLAAFRSDDDIQLITHTKVEKDINLSDLIESYGLSPAQSDWISTAIESRFPIVRTSDSPYEPIGSILGFPPDYSCIAAPLRIGDQTIGLLTLVHQSPNRYGSESQAMTATFAGYAAVAIENTRLYEAAHDQAWISTVLLQVAEATQALTSQLELLETVVHIIPTLVGVRACGILLWDKSFEALVPATSYGLTPEQEDQFKQWYILEHDFDLFDEVCNTHAPMVINITSDLLPDTEQLLKSFGVVNDIVVLFPMISQLELQGIIIIDFGSQSSRNNAVKDLWDEKFSIIQGIAHQTAIAVENIKLLEAQEEEAYISVALLQVAQAVVSQNELDDVLAAIVRITPILVGVKRCVIYLWDPDLGVFRQSQTYGISRNEASVIPQSFSPDDFPLLECVRQNDRLIYHFIPEGGESPATWSALAPDQWEIADLPSFDAGSSEEQKQSKTFFYTKSRMLLGFPLSVKGSVLGVMITEEEESQKGIPSYHVRDKRLEIVTGIVQQASLAIQNDLYQRETVERERLERELQLAREIQRTFLPDELPKITNWDLDIRWDPAYQVGGDFYDVFVLPENKIGIVIADVADKGMPAALFMTLVRTLLRAAVREHQSPARILQQVNNWLVPDSKNGMFVTILLAVLSPDTGTLVYANAGHNPPLLKRSMVDSIESLPRTGMALGVLENVDLTEKAIQIEFGDCLVFYTDGVTEAFSSGGELYGVEQLINVLQTEVCDSSTDLISKIIKSVDHFTGGSPRSDDLTLGVLMRNRVL